MAFVVTEACVKCKYTDCVAVCPVDCFHEGENMLVIDPVECIDCGACVPACPTAAIFLDVDLTPDQLEWAGINARLAKVWPVIDRQKPPLPEADAFKAVRGKRAMLSERRGG